MPDYSKMRGRTLHNHALAITNNVLEQMELGNDNVHPAAFLIVAKAFNELVLEKYFGVLVDERGEPDVISAAVAAAERILKGEG
jgi:hypothetical protein